MLILLYVFAAGAYQSPEHPSAQGAQIPPRPPWALCRSHLVPAKGCRTMVVEVLPALGRKPAPLAPCNPYRDCKALSVASASAWLGIQPAMQTGCACHYQSLQAGRQAAPPNSSHECGKGTKTRRAVFGIALSFYLTGLYPLKIGRNLSEKGAASKSPLQFWLTMSPAILH